MISRRALLKWFGVTVPVACVRVTVPGGGFLTPNVYEVSWEGSIEASELEQVFRALRQRQAFVVLPRGVSLQRVWPV